MKHSDFEEWLFKTMDYSRFPEQYPKKGEDMEKICKNCSAWNPKFYANLLSYTGDTPVEECGLFRLYVRTDMSCPRWKAKESEIPAKLKGWKPVWHKITESSIMSKKGQTVLVCSGGDFTEVMWDGKHFRETWSDDTYYTHDDLWTELP